MPSVLTVLIIYLDEEAEVCVDDLKVCVVLQLLLQHLQEENHQPQAPSTLGCWDNKSKWKCNKGIRTSQKNMNTKKSLISISHTNKKTAHNISKRKFK